MQIEVVRGSVTDQKVDAIVNAANTMMRGGGGIDGRIHQLAGRKMLDELYRVAPQGAKVSEAVVTPGFNLQQKYVIHIAGPIWRNGTEGEPELLKASYRNACLAAEDLNCKSIGFCSISTGSYGYPLSLAAPIAVSTVHETMSGLKSLEQVVFAMFGKEEYDSFASAVESV